MTITEFLEARIAEDEAAAKRADEVFPGSWDIEDRGWYARVVCDGPNFHCVSELDQKQAPDVAWLGGALQNVANYQPARVLAECAAKREIVASAEPEGWMDNHAHSGYADAIDMALSALAAVYRDHPDYQEAWRA